MLYDSITPSVPDKAPAYLPTGLNVKQVPRTTSEGYGYWLKPFVHRDASGKTVKVASYFEGWDNPLSLSRLCLAPFLIHPETKLPE